MFWFMILCTAIMQGTYMVLIYADNEYNPVYVYSATIIFSVKLILDLYMVLIFNRVAKHLLKDKFQTFLRMIIQSLLSIPIILFNMTDPLWSYFNLIQTIKYNQNYSDTCPEMLTKNDNCRCYDK